ncbi:GH32 C-terminal domain-containing protein [Actinacidiphila cocklensis]|nr:GH32 C-terminal domain-containing protein [Actinacidiphila cocklensis]WSX75602.1 GH32 C-terminal domain-containing protein [Streptomyces sp. NBC_00899]
MLLALLLCLPLGSVLTAPSASAAAIDIVNPGFETGDLSGWTPSGTAFQAGSVSSDPGWGWGCCFNQQGTYHLWGFKAGGDAAVGMLTSDAFTLSGTGMVSALVSGGNDPDHEYVALTLADGTVLQKATGLNDEAYRRVTWDVRDRVGQQLRIKVVDQATGGWGHINLDDVRVGLDAAASTTLANPDFETGDLTGWTPSGTAFQAAAVTSDTGWGWGCCFNQQGTYHLWGFKAGGDAAVGTLTSNAFTLSGTGMVSALVSGGQDLNNLYVALTLADGTVLQKATGLNGEAYRRVTWDVRDRVGQQLRIKVVDQATGDFGHINLDDVRVGLDQPKDPNGGPVAYWNFDEGKGAATTERISHQADPISYVFNNAVYKPNSDPLWQPADAGKGVLSKALLFDGYSTWVTRSAAQVPAVSDGLTLDAWVAPRAFEWGDAGKVSAIVNQQDAGANRGFSLGVGRHGVWKLGVGTGDAWREVTVPQSAALTAGSWAHVVATFDSAHGLMRLYLNGAQVAETAVPVGALIQPASVPLLIGRHNQPEIINGTFAVNMFSGLIDEVKVYDRPLDATQVAQEHSQDLATFVGGKIPTADMTEDRSKYAGDKYRPGYHFTPPNAWMNEPHAPIFINGQYHLFYQHNVHGPYWHNISWGHAVSKDLVHWRDLPVALAPTADSVAPDGVWSGGATTDANGNPVLFFTAGNDSQHPNQAVGTARPVDPTDPDLEQWKMDPQLVTQQDPNANVGTGRKVRVGEFRDPYVWKEGSVWYELVGSGVQTTGGADVGGTALMYSSTDLTHWTYVGPLMTGDVNAYPKSGQVWELPVFLPIGKDAQGRQRNVLLVNPAFPNGSPYSSKNTLYWVGTWDHATHTWTPDSAAPRMFDYGEHFTGPSGTVDAKGRSLVFSIAQDRRTEQAHYDAGWAHNAGLPVQLSMLPDGDLGIKPVDELTSLHAGSPLVDVTGPLSIADVNTNLASVKGDMLHIRLTMEPGTAQNFGLDVLRSPAGEERTRLFYDNSGGGTFGVDRTKTGNNSDVDSNLGVQSGPLALDGGKVSLDVFLDRSMVEAYADSFKSITTRAYDFRDDSLGLQLFGDGAKVDSMTVWRMNSMTS